MADTPFEIPQALRNVTEQNIKQAHAAYDQLIRSATQGVAKDVNDFSGLDGELPDQGSSA
jgi:hypothetical protein